MTVGLVQGQLRGFNYSVKQLKENLFEPLGCKDLIFLLPEDDKEREVKTFLEDYNIHLIYEKEIFHDEFNLPSPHSLTYSSHCIAHNKYPLRGNLQHYFIQLYNKKRVFELYKQIYGTEENTLLMFRPDLAPHKKLDVNTLKLECINVPNCPQWYGVYDRLCIGNYNNVETYSSLYDNVKTLPPCGINNAESRLKAWLDKNSICVNIFELGEVLRYNVDGSTRDS